MVYSYYPGCTLKTKAKELDIYARRSMEALGITLEELPMWQCCGGAYTSSVDEAATKLSSVRALIDAGQKNTDLVTLCSACHNVLKRTNYDMANNAEFAAKVNNYNKGSYPEYHGETNVIHFLELLRDKVGFDELKKKVVKPFKDVKIAAYYGCLLLRPGNVMAFDDPENPKIMEEFIRAIGATPVEYAMKNECCGGYVTHEDNKIAEKKSARIVDNASEFGADLMVTACPLCLYNLTVNTEGKLPVVYFTKLLAEALGVAEGVENE